MSVSIQNNEVLLFTGAGASADANVPTMQKMVKSIEDEIQTTWDKYRDLYNYIKSAIFYSRGISGVFSSRLDIEELLFVITDILLREKNPLYPFVGAWNHRLIDLAGGDFEKLDNFKKLIREKLFFWINLTRYTDASYYAGFHKLQQELQFPIRIFTLNYDICLERILDSRCRIELGFSKDNQEWSAEQFEQTGDTDIFIYKLHGSIDWVRQSDGAGALQRVDSPNPDAELIFGERQKVFMYDPYLYELAELRRFTLHENCRMIISIGYGFGDSHINELFRQALRLSADRQLMVVLNDADEVKGAILEHFGDLSDKINFTSATGKEFIGQTLDLEYLRSWLKPGESGPF